MPFADEPRLRYVGMGWYESTGPTVHVVPKWAKRLPPGLVTTIPTGTRSDLASTPRIFWNVLPPTGAYEQGAYVHDEGCNECRRAYDEGRPPRLSPRQVDQLFLLILEEADRAACEAGDKRGRIPAWKRRVLWSGVRIGALINPARRPGIARDLPLVALITLLELAAVVAVLLGVHALIDLIL